VYNKRLNKYGINVYTITKQDLNKNFMSNSLGFLTIDIKIEHTDITKSIKNIIDNA